MSRLPSLAAMSLAALLLAALATPLPAAAQATDALLILDASGSMWGQVDGQTKISAAKRAVDSILAKWKPADRLGLMVYGHRQKGDCKDIELMVPVGTFDPARIKAAVQGLNPKGKTPIADSLREAAKALRSTENKTTVILVSDGIDTCAPDPCAVAGELKKSGIAFTAHVIGFDVADPVAKAQLQCIARVTGGVYLDAREASGLEQALGRAVAATQGAKVQSEAPAKAEPDPYKGKNIRGVARLAAGLDPISDAELGWSVFKPTPDGEAGEFVQRFDGSPFAAKADGQEGEWVATEYNMLSQFDLPGAAYDVVVSVGAAKRVVRAEVKSGAPTRLNVNLDAGVLGLRANGASDVEILAAELDINNERRSVHIGYDPQLNLALNAGAYVAVIGFPDGAKVEKPFTVAAGKRVELDVKK